MEANESKDEKGHGESWDRDFSGAAPGEAPGAGAGPGYRLSAKSVCDAARDMKDQAEDAIMALLPPEVTEHLVASKKELIRAGQRLGDLALENLDRKAARARDIHERMKAARQAQ